MEKLLCVCKAVFLWGFLEKVLQYAVNRVIIEILNKNGGSINGKKVDFIDYGM